MTINRYDEDTIECRLTPEDLKNRHLLLSELSYSSPVLRSLTSDLLRFLAKKYNFTVASDEPVSIEAVPMSDGSLSVIFSKNAYADDIDPRYSLFSDAEEDTTDEEAGPASIQDAIHRMIDTIVNSSDTASRYLLYSDSTEDESATTKGVFVFDSFSDLLHLFGVLSESVPMSVSVFRSERDAYMMICHFYRLDDEELRDLLSIICEYGMIRKMSEGTESYINEHCEMIMPLVPFIIAKTLISSK